MSRMILSAINNGLTDVTEVVRAAINSFPATGGQLFFPAGTYRISGSLYYPSFMSFVGENTRTTSILMNGTASIFVPKNKGVAQTSHLTFSDMFLNNNIAISTGAFGIDGEGLQNSQIERLWISTQEKGIYLAGIPGGVGGGGYNEIISCEISSCNYGVYFYNAAQANRIVGGRIHGNLYSAIYSDTSGGNFVQTAIESHDNRPAIVLSASLAWTISNTYFEGNNLGAIEFSTGSTRNTEIGNYYSAAVDSVTDLTGFNISLSSLSRGNSLSGLGTGWNLITGSFDKDSNSDGIADGWAVPPAPAIGMSLALDSTTRKHITGSSQKWKVNAGGTSVRNLVCSASVQAGEVYTFSGWFYTDTPNNWYIFIGQLPTDASYFQQTITKTNEWHYIKQSFQPTTQACVITISNTHFGPSAADQNIWLDSFKIEKGSIPTAFDVGVAQGI